MPKVKRKLDPEIVVELKSVLYEQAKERGLLYIGQDGAHLTGIPARNIAPAEVPLIGPRRLPELLESGLYELNEVKND